MNIKFQKKNFKILNTTANSSCSGIRDKMILKSDPQAMFGLIQKSDPQPNKGQRQNGCCYGGFKLAPSISIMSGQPLYTDCVNNILPLSMIFYICLCFLNIIIEWPFHKGEIEDNKAKPGV